ncbi:peptidase C39 bacteriocin processing [Methanothermus fervidus DSM 2088]|uniref:Peptidase C39 bacteriocin processing n=1 Tax=Methanothermus fervidus (strain ATCC 43054 / DSM 2088 / JCM 10308 / V24 S) TaxID=523846 RepID=E3GZK6_METFV|nr:cysteine peptidase family C39 domain-containing protein [Methanothermus fervidus]ADP77738.1 peptidase C39 bacteriocin processing [Methanothermus fervidus DSM 2088]
MKSFYIWTVLVVLVAMVSVSCVSAADTISSQHSNDTLCIMDATGYTADISTIHSEIEKTDVILQSKDYTCGPAALSMVLQKLGIQATEDELAALAGTTEEGTTMQGLVEAAKAKGVNAVGMKLGINELKENMIVHLMKDGEGHYAVVKEITANTIKLADPGLGNIELSLEKFQEIYTGNALVINQTTNQNTSNTNKTEENITTSNKILSKEEMQNIKGKGWLNRLWRKIKRALLRWWHYQKVFQQYHSYPPYGVW